MLACLAEGTSKIRGLLLGEDVLSTMRIFQQLGIKMSHTPQELKPEDELLIYGQGLKGLKPSSEILYCGNSGTTMRLLLGILAAQGFDSVLTGDESLNKRPMDRVMNPLREMGAEFDSQTKNGQRLIHVHGNSKLKPLQFKMPVASAQLKSCLILASLVSGVELELDQPAQSRDHTERMLAEMGVKIEVDDLKLKFKPQSKLTSLDIDVPSDFSSAAFFIVAGLLVPDSKLTIQSVGVNPTRSGLNDILIKMGAKISLAGDISGAGEPVADILIESSNLRGAEVSGDIIPNLIDEIPILSIAQACAQGRSEISDAQELRVKESDRISRLLEELSKLGVKAQEKEDGFIIEGPQSFKSGEFQSHGDHRLAMSLAVASLLSDQASVIQNIDCVNTSFPGFFDLLNQIRS